MRSLDSVESWWFGRLTAGMISHKHDRWIDAIAFDALFDDYVSETEKIGVRRKAEQTVFGMKMHDLVPGLTKRRTTQTESDGVVARRVWSYVMPSLGDCPAAFEGCVGQRIIWVEPHG